MNKPRPSELLSSHARASHRESPASNDCEGSRSGHSLRSQARYLVVLLVAITISFWSNRVLAEVIFVAPHIALLEAGDSR